MKGKKMCTKRNDQVGNKEAAEIPIRPAKSSKDAPVQFVVVPQQESQVEKDLFISTFLGTLKSESASSADARDEIETLRRGASPGVRHRCPTDELISDELSPLHEGDKHNSNSNMDVDLLLLCSTDENLTDEYTSGTSFDTAAASSCDTGSGFDTGTSFDTGSTSSFETMQLRSLYNDSVMGRPSDERQCGPFFLARHSTNGFATLNLCSRQLSDPLDEKQDLIRNSSSINFRDESESVEEPYLCSALGVGLLSEDNSMQYESNTILEEIGLLTPLELLNACSPRATLLEFRKSRGARSYYDGDKEKCLVTRKQLREESKSSVPIFTVLSSPQNKGSVYMPPRVDEAPIVETRMAQEGNLADPFDTRCAGGEAPRLDEIHSDIQQKTRQEDEKRTRIAAELAERRRIESRAAALAFLSSLLACKPSAFSLHADMNAATDNGGPIASACLEEIDNFETSNDVSAQICWNGRLPLHVDEYNIPETTREQVGQLRNMPPLPFGVQNWAPQHGSKLATSSRVNNTAVLESAITHGEPIHDRFDNTANATPRMNEIYVCISKEILIKEEKHACIVKALEEQRKRESKAATRESTRNIWFSVMYSDRRPKNLIEWKDDLASCFWHNVSARNAKLPMDQWEEEGSEIEMENSDGVVSSVVSSSSPELNGNKKRDLTETRPDLTGSKLSSEDSNRPTSALIGWICATKDDLIDQVNDPFFLGGAQPAAPMPVGEIVLTVEHPTARLAHTTTCVSCCLHVARQTSTSGKRTLLTDHTPNGGESLRLSDRQSIIAEHGCARQKKHRNGNESTVTSPAVNPQQVNSGVRVSIDSYGCMHESETSKTHRRTAESSRLSALRRQNASIAIETDDDTKPTDSLNSVAEPPTRRLGEKSARLSYAVTPERVLQSLPWNIETTSSSRGPTDNNPPAGDLRAQLMRCSASLELVVELSKKRMSEAARKIAQVADSKILLESLGGNPTSEYRAEATLQPKAALDSIRGHCEENHSNCYGLDKIWNALESICQSSAARQTKDTGR